MGQRGVRNRREIRKSRRDFGYFRQVAAPVSWQLLNSMTLIVSWLRSSTENVEMAALCPGVKYGLSSQQNFGEKKDLIYVKLTDSALRAIEEHLKNQVGFFSLTFSTIRDCVLVIR